MDLSFADVAKAQKRIKGHVLRTPLRESMALVDEDGASRYYLKLECHQLTRSFKIRGALNKMMTLSQEEKRAGVVAASSGNHGAGVSLAGHLLGDTSVRIFVPQNTPGAKMAMMRRFGADVVRAGADYNETHRRAEEHCRKEGSTYIDPCSDPEVIAGQGTVGLEMMLQQPDLDTVLVPVGGGGLITGISLACKAIDPEVEVVGVQTEACPAMVKSLEDSVPYFDFPIGESICDALLGGVGEIPFQMAGRCIDRMLTVEEEWVKEAVWTLLDEDKIVAEPGGAVGVAGVLQAGRSHECFCFDAKRVGIVISGGNLNTSLLADTIRSRC